MWGHGRVGLHRAGGFWRCSHTRDPSSGRDVTSESRCVPGWEQGAPGEGLKTLNHKGDAPQRTLSQKGDVPRGMVSSRGCPRDAESRG